MQDRRRFLRSAAALGALPVLGHAARAPGPAADFDALWRAIDEGYAYFEKGQDWRGARARWRPRAAAARSRDELLAALEGALAELHDDGVGLDAHSPRSPRPVPAETDLCAEWDGADARISAVRAGSVADVAGAVPGMQIAAIGSKPIEEAVRALLRRDRQAEARARNWALRRLVAGPWSGVLDLEVKSGGRTRRLAIERQDIPHAGTPPLIARRIGEGRDLGYLRLKNNLGEAGLVQHFDAAMQHFRDTRGLIVDLRETQGGGSPEVARALLGRFATRETAWIRRVSRARGAGSDTPAETIGPRGPFTHAGPVAVLVDAWTAGEGESLAVGLEVVAKATLVGTRMAGLRGDLREARLPGSGISVHFPSARVYHPDGTPREAVRPTLPVDLVAPSGGPGDPILYQALKYLEARLPAVPRR